MARKVGEHLIGKLGPTVTSVVNGVEVTRTQNSHPHDPFTIKQRIQRSKMKFASRFLRTLKLTIIAGYQGTTFDNPYNEAKSSICMNAFRVEGTKITVLYENILVSRGLLAKGEECNLAPDGDSYTITWKIPARKSGISLNDNVNLVMYSDVSDGQQWHEFSVARRSAGTLTGKIPKSDMPVHFWIFFHNGDMTAKPSKSNISDSVYLGTAPSDAPPQVIDAMKYVKKKG